MWSLSKTGPGCQHTSILSCDPPPQQIIGDHMVAAASDFRVVFARMAEQAVISRAELGALLGKTPGAISQMKFLGELPPTAFPGKKKACWFVRDIRDWLDQLATERPVPAGLGEDTGPVPRRTGRPRAS
jgi:hypothetical protein